MGVDWTEVNERRISEKTQEIQLYCSRKKADMTPRVFELARISFGRLLENISNRNPQSALTCKTIQRSMESQDETIATCSEKHAAILARGIVYNYIGDDLNLYPITAEQKVQCAKIRGYKECDIPMEELTSRDIIYIAAASTEGEVFSNRTLRYVYAWFQDMGIDPIEARVFSSLFIKSKPVSIKSLPQQAIFCDEYKKAAKSLAEKGFIVEMPNGLYCVTEFNIE